MGWVNDRGLRPETAGHSGPVRAPRIVFIDDEPWFGEFGELLIARLFPEVTILAFRNRDTAWRELQRADPDLLITDMNNDNVPGRTEPFGMSGWELLPLLAQREVKYPILVVSGSFAMPGVESRARQCASPKLDVSFLTKPFTEEHFQREVTCLLGGGGLGQRLPKGKR
jgi:CheY-like chemotaxis protein